MVNGFSGDGRIATAAQFDGLFTVATTPNGDFFIADVFNRRIRAVRGPIEASTMRAGPVLAPRDANRDKSDEVGPGAALQAWLSYATGRVALPLLPDLGYAPDPGEPNIMASLRGAPAAAAGGLGQPVAGPSDPSLRMRTTKATCIRGDLAVIGRLQVKNLFPSLAAVKMKLTPTLHERGLEVNLADGVFGFPPGFDRNLGPVVLFDIRPAVPVPGRWELIFSLESTMGTLLTEERRSFLIL